MTDMRVLGTVGLKTVLALALAYVLVGALQFVLKCKRQKGYPPGPPALPVLGNLFDVPLSKPFLTFQKWASTYGDIIGLKVGPMNLIVLNDPKDVRELFDRRGIKFSDRPYNSITLEYIAPKEGGHILFTNRDANWRRWRAAVRHLLGPAGCEQALPIQGAVASRLVRDIIQHPQDHVNHTRRWGFLAPFISICGGRDVDDEVVDSFFETQHKWLDLLEPGKAPPVDILPFLKWMPCSLAKWKQDAAWVRGKQSAFYTGLLESAKAQMAVHELDPNSDTARYQCLMAKILRENKFEDWTDAKVAYLGGGLLDAAVEMTMSTLRSFLLALAAYPDVQKRAQEEVDELCGDVPPQIEDLKQLSYLDACVLETFRWRPAAPMTLPHHTTEDDTYRGLLIPKNSTVISNTWAINHNERYFESAHVFSPERYLEDPSGMRPEVVRDNQKDFRQTSWVFGVGRRACPGDHFGRQGLLIAFAKLVWAFGVVADGPIDTSIETGFDHGLVITPRHSNIKIVPRSDSRRQAALDDYMKAEKLMDEML